MKRILITVFVVGAAVAAAAFILKSNKEKMQEQTELAKKVNSTIPVQVESVKEESIGGTFTATGSFEPARQIVVVTELAGKAISLPVKEGQFVSKGQLLARIEYATHEADLRSAEANLQKLSTDKERYQRLVASGGVTQAQLDEVNLAYVNAESRVVSAKKRLADSYIRAPFAGYVNKRFVEEGAYLNAAKEVFEIVETSRLKMAVNVSESQVLSVSQADRITVQADVYPGTEYKATLNFIGAKADANLNFPVELQIENVKDKPLRSGMYGRATFHLLESRPSLVIPRSALLGSAEDARVYVVNDGAVELKEFVAGRTFSNSIEVVSGLEKGAKVVINGQINLSPGAKVTVLNQ
jgi:RND family efflux transporter MFP subunit